jgi:uncharacterized protein (TIGR03437 family)
MVMRLFILGLVSVVSLLAQRAETRYFRAVMLPSNEVPAVNINATGGALIVAHVMRNAAGEVASGSVDFIVNYNLPGAATFTGLHIHRGPAGENGPVVINTGIGGAGGNVDDPTGRAGVRRLAHVRPTETAALAALRDMLDNPAGFYVNIHTTVNPGGVIRGQLMVPEMTTLMTVMSPRNEVPAIADLNASGITAIRAMRTFDDAGNLTSGMVIFEAAYQFPAATMFTGYHIHAAPAGVNGPVTINTGLANMPSAESGSGNLMFPVEVALNNQAAVNTLNGLFNDPSGYYANLHTPANPGGAIRGQLRKADRNVYQVNLLPSNEVPAADLAASAPSEIVINTIRGEDGSVIAGRFEYNINYRFPGAAEFTGLHIHNGEAGVNGPVTLNSGLALADGEATQTGFGNISRFGLTMSEAGLATLNSLLASPEKHYLNLHTRANPGGAVRAQVGAAIGRPAVGEALSAIVSPGQRNVAPGGLVSIFGARLAAANGDVQSWEGSRLPSSLNGTSATIGGRTAPLVMVSEGQINAVVPYETAEGMQPVMVRNAGGDSAGFNIMVARYAPAIWLFGANGGQILRGDNFNFITADNPARRGDTLYVWCTGLGQTTPPLETGAVVPESPTRNTQAVTATIGASAATVSSSIAAAGIPGVYIVTLQVPANAAVGMQQLQLRAGGVASNTVMLPVQ